MHPSSAATLDLAGALAFGVAAGFSPGPLMVVLLDATLRGGFAMGMKVALAPLITDGPVIGLTYLVLSGLATHIGVGTLLAGTSFAGAAYLIWLGTHALTKRSPGTDQPPPTTGSVLRTAVTVNWLNPNPWIFWLTLGGPYLLAHRGDALRQSAFLVAFYLPLVGAKLLVAVLIHRHRHRPALSGRWISIAMAGMLFLFAGKLLYDGFRSLLTHQW